MPGIVLFGRRWGFASDDLFFPGLTEIFLRLIWLSAFAATFQIHREAFSCHQSGLLSTYFIGELVTLSFIILLQCIIVVLSARGTIMIQRPRRHIPIFLYLRVIAFLTEISWSILGTWWAFNDEHCDANVLLVVQLAVGASWVILLIVSAGIFLVFDPLGYTTSRGSGDYAERAERVWQHRLKLFFCCVCDEQARGAIDDVSRMLADFFEDTDLVPSDIVCGLFLLQAEDDELDSASEPSFHSSSINFDELPDWMNLHNVTYYVKYALASYGWPFYVYFQKCFGCCNLCFGHCCPGKPINIGSVVDDNACGCNLLTLRKMLAVDVVYASFRNRIYEVPFYVCVDEKDRTVVVAIRGTLSLRDTITDLSAASEFIAVDGLLNPYCHKGMLRAALLVQQKLTVERILDEAFQGREDYNLVLTGHSLGAGTATILSILLKPQFPTLKCFAYSPPGGLLSEELVHYTETFVCSIVVGDDIIPRLSVPNMERLKERLIQVLMSNPLPKYKILQRACWVASCGIRRSKPSGERQRMISSRPTSRFTEDEHAPFLNQDIEAPSSLMAPLSGSSFNLFPPGAILHIKERDSAGCCLCCLRPQYECGWTRSAAMSDIVVSSRMLTHHFPDVVWKALESVALVQVDQ